MTTTQVPDNFKAEDPPAWWPTECYAAWLACEDITFGDRFLSAPEIESRTHVQLDPDVGAAKDGNLFTTVALPLSHLRRHSAPREGPYSTRFAAIKLAARVRAQGWCGETVAKIDTFHPLGGERRLAHWKATAGTCAWSCPQKVRGALSATSRVRMMLVTPAVFRDGWKPGWLNDELIGTPPGLNVSLRLVGTSIQRWRAVSGWSLAKHGPKPVKRLVPPGGVYFFEIIDGKASAFADRWLEPVSDDKQDQRDGFGIAVWGIW